MVASVLLKRWLYSAVEKEADTDRWHEVWSLMIVFAGGTATRRQCARIPLSEQESKTAFVRNHKAEEM